MLRLPTIMIGVDQNSPSLDSPYSSVASYNIRMHGTFGRQFHLTTRIHECAFGSPNAHANRTTHSSWSRLAGQIAWSYQVGEILFPFHLHPQHLTCKFEHLFRQSSRARWIWFNCNLLRTTFSAQVHQSRWLQYKNKTLCFWPVDAMFITCSGE